MATNVNPHPAMERAADSICPNAPPKAAVLDLLSALSDGIPDVEPRRILEKTYSGLPRRPVTVSEFYSLMAETAQSMLLTSPHYMKLAGAIEQLGLQFETLGHGKCAMNRSPEVEGMPKSVMMVKMDMDAAAAAAATVDVPETIPVTIPPPMSFATVADRVNSVVTRGKPSPRYHAKLHELLRDPKTAARVDAMIDKYAAKAPTPFFDAVRSMRRTYLICDSTGRILEMPVHMCIRVALGLHIMCREPSPIPVPGMEVVDMDAPWEIDVPDASKWGVVGDDVFWADVEATFRMLYLRHGLHATPTMMNGGTIFPMYASCYLGVCEDSLKSINDTQSRLGMDSKFGSGNGLDVSRFRLKGAPIRSTSGWSNGPFAWLKIFADTLEGVDQGGGKRKGACTFFLADWHGFIFALIQFRSNKQSKDDEYRLELPTTCIAVSDLFMKRVKAKGNWTLFDPSAFDKDAHLCDLWGDAYEEAYLRYEREGRGVMTFPAELLYREICVQQKETGCPYIFFKDTANRSSNMAHMGTTVSLNLCMEIRQMATPDNWQMCNLGSLNMAAYVNGSVWKAGKTPAPNLDLFDHDGYMSTARQLVRNINAAIDGGVYVMKGAAQANFFARPMGIGLQGWADALARMGVDPESPMANAFATRTTAELYYACVDESVRLAAVHGPAPGFDGCPMSKGKLHPDLWTGEDGAAERLAPHLDWAGLRARIAAHGARNLMFVALMPTASTSVLCNNSFSEMTDPFKSLYMVRSMLAGEYGTIPPVLSEALSAVGISMDDAVKYIVEHRGSIQGLEGAPDVFTAAFKTVYDIKPSKIVAQNAGRQPFVDQSISMNIHMKRCTVERLEKMHKDTWEKKLVTGMYYLRTQPTQGAAAVTKRRVKAPLTETPADPETFGPVCRRDDPDCAACQ